MIGKNIKTFEELDSTNNFVKLNVSNLESGAVIVAKKQTKGRGLRDNKWDSNLGNLYFSFIIKDNVFRSNLFTYIVQSSVAIIRTLKQFGINADIKYPNDCLVESKKITGILIESSGTSALNYIVVGIGININQIDFGDLNDKATSMKKILNDDFNVNVVLNEFVKNYNNILESNNQKVFEEYIKASIVIGKRISYKNEQYVISDIEQNGTIIINNDLDEKRVAFSEISLEELYWHD